MAASETNISENGTNRKPRWKRPKEKKKFTEAEMRLIKASRAVMEVIQEQKARGDFDEIIKQKEEVMEISNQNNKSGEIKTKPRRKLPKTNNEYTEAEMARIKASRAVMKVIQKQVERGDFDEYLNEEVSKI